VVHLAETGTTGRDLVSYVHICN